MTILFHNEHHVLLHDSICCDCAYIRLNVHCIWAGVSLELYQYLRHMYACVRVIPKRYRGMRHAARAWRWTMLVQSVRELNHVVQTLWWTILVRSSVQELNHAVQTLWWTMNNPSAIICTGTEPCYTKFGDKEIARATESPFRGIVVRNNDDEPPRSYLPFSILKTLVVLSFCSRANSKTTTAGERAVREVLWRGIGIEVVGITSKNWVTGLKRLKFEVP